MLVVQSNLRTRQVYPLDGDLSTLRSARRALQLDLDLDLTLFLWSLGHIMKGVRCGIYKNVLHIVKRTKNLKSLSVQK